MANRYYIPSDDTSTSVLSRLNAASRKSRTLLAKHLTAAGVYPGQEAVIVALAEAKSMTPSQIARVLGVRPPTVTKTLTRLQHQGFIEKASSPEDGRLVHVALTESGHGVLGQIRKAMRKTEKQALKGLKKKERKQIDKLLSALDTNLDGHADK